ncbi:amylopullulanase [Reinekea sp. MED297]|uniref:Amylopullulanase n=1 Tax=Reinekea blandensis MED297 TaxID=314283 RepID=A4BFK8_9GAMM|nr:amylopullulanase [Reinekea sp. MED297] [Reinekea blandensis MED297]
MTADAGLTSATLVIEERTLVGNYDEFSYTELTKDPMAKVVTAEGERWEASYTFPDVAVYGYYFEVVANGETYIVHNNDFSVYWTPEKGSGGESMIAFQPSDTDAVRRYRHSSYDGTFAVPEWSKNAIYYYIFPERFRNGDTSNDPTVGQDTILGEAVEVHSDWNDAPWVPGTGDGSDEFYNNDFFGGDLQGIVEKLDYLADLGVNTLYINPIFEAASNHKYDTADYKNIDDNFGDNALFETLTTEASNRGIRVILDTSLNHTGSDSKYFDRYENFAELGAFEGETIQESSPFYDWYTFDPAGTTPEAMYEGWVGVDSLPNLNESDSWKAYAYGDADSVTNMWLDKGASGWRMDVAPWVSDEFWREWRDVVKANDADALTVAETWFDASKHLLGDMFDSTMNYIFRNAVQDFAAGESAEEMYQNLELMRENYPQEAFYALMNLLSTHDAARALHHFGYTGPESSAEAVAEAKTRLKLAVLFQMAYPGAPAIFYGDEVGVTGGEDPYNRATYPWADEGGNPDMALLDDFKALIQMRNDNAVLRTGSIDAPVYADENVIVLVRELNGTHAITAFNNAAETSEVTFTVDDLASLNFNDALSSEALAVPASGEITLTLPAIGGQVFISQ